MLVEASWKRRPLIWGDSLSLLGCCSLIDRLCGHTDFLGAVDKESRPVEDHDEFPHLALDFWYGNAAVSARIQ